MHLSLGHLAMFNYCCLSQKGKFSACWATLWLRSSAPEADGAERPAVYFLRVAKVVLRRLPYFTELDDSQTGPYSYQPARNPTLQSFSKIVQVAPMPKCKRYIGIYHWVVVILRPGNQDIHAGDRERFPVAVLRGS
ncbi:hypothetical protein VPH35_079639 [Triticum aestivum]